MLQAQATRAPMTPVKSPMKKTLATGKGGADSRASSSRWRSGSFTNFWRNSRSNSSHIVCLSVDMAVPPLYEGEQKKTFHTIKRPMAAVSLSDAWNEAPHVPEAAGNRRQISAKAASNSPRVIDHAEEEDSTNSAIISETNERFESLLNEFRTLRFEESRRCTVYLAVGGILFSILFMYIDRLQRQIQMLTGGMVREPVYSGTYHPQPPPNSLQTYTPVAPVQPGTSFRALRRW